jgi:hypothetical protein
MGLVFVPSQPGRTIPIRLCRAGCCACAEQASALAAVSAIKSRLLIRLNRQSVGADRRVVTIWIEADKARGDKALGPSWVKRRNTRVEQMFSALPLSNGHRQASPVGPVRAISGPCRRLD